MVGRVLILESEESALATAKYALASDTTISVIGAYTWDEAQTEMDREPVDVFIARAKMVEVEALAAMRQRRAATVRLLVATQAERAAIDKSMLLAHMFLPRPYPREMLRMAVQRALSLRDVMQHSEVRELLGKLDRLPATPSTYREIDDALRNRGAAALDVARVVERDPAVLAKVLQTVNSAYFGLNRRLTLASEAVSFLGVELVKTIALTAHVCAMLGERPRQAGFSIDVEQAHAIAVAKLAQTIAPRRDIAVTAYTAGLLHGIGRLVLSMSASRHARQIDHSAVGSYLLGLWGLPEAVVEAVAFHKMPRRSERKEMNAIAALHIAEALLSNVAPDMIYLGAIGVAHRINEWQALASHASNRSAAPSFARAGS